MEINVNLSKEPFSTGSGRLTLKNCPRDYFHLLISPNFTLWVLGCNGSYSRVFTVLIDPSKEGLMHSRILNCSKMFT